MEYVHLHHSNISGTNRTYLFLPWKGTKFSKDLTVWYCRISTWGFILPVRGVRPAIDILVQMALKLTANIRAAPLHSRLIIFVAESKFFASGTIERCSIFSISWQKHLNESISDATICCFYYQQNTYVLLILLYDWALNLT